MRMTYKEEPSYFKIESAKQILFEAVGSVLVPLQNGTGCQIDLVLAEVWYFSALQFNLISTYRLGKNGIKIQLKAYIQLLKLIYRKKILGFDDSINQQYHIWILQEDKSQTFITNNYESDLYQI